LPRAALSRLIAGASTVTIERGAAAASTPALSAMVASIAPRFGLVVSERAAASALPVFGALGGATLNMLFVRHFQRAAHGHFTVRRLERLYGLDVVGAYYSALVLKSPRRSES
jgi:EcsC protein family